MKLNDQRCGMLKALKKQSARNKYVPPHIAEKYKDDRSAITDRIQSRNQ